MIAQKTLDELENLETNNTAYTKYAENIRFIKNNYLDKLFNDLFEEIKHGDQEHQDWLKNKIEEFKQKQLK